MTDQKLKDAPDVIKFLLGEGTLDGFSFGEFPDNGEKYKRRHWWRKALREAWNTRAAQPQPPVIEGLDEAISRTAAKLAIHCDCDDAECPVCKTLRAASLYAQGQTAQPQGDLVLCRRVIKEPEHDGATGYEYFVPVKEAQPVDLVGFDKQPTEDAQRALQLFNDYFSTDPAVKNDEELQGMVKTIRAALTQQEFEVVDVDSVEPIVDRSAARHLSEKGYQLVRKKGGVLN